MGGEYREHSTISIPIQATQGYNSDPKKLIEVIKTTKYLRINKLKQNKINTTKRIYDDTINPPKIQNMILNMKEKLHV